MGTVDARPPGAVVLDRTLFYPEGGGQPSDRGVLRRRDGTTWAVIGVTRPGRDVIHRVDPSDRRAPPLALGEELHGELDWDRRYSFMRSHTAQHLASARLFATRGVRTRRAWIGLGRAEVELERGLGEGMSPDDLERDVREWVRSNAPVRVVERPRSEYEADPAARSGLVPLPRSVEKVRLIEIEGTDLAPCGGTHVRGLGEIGNVNVRYAPGSQTRVMLELGPAPSPTGAPTA